MGKRSLVKCLMTMASLFRFKFRFWAFEGFCCFQTCLSSMPHKKGAPTFPNTENEEENTKRCKSLGCCV